MDWAETTARQDKKHFSLGIWCFTVCNTFKNTIHLKKTTHGSCLVVWCYGMLPIDFIHVLTHRGRDRNAAFWQTRCSTPFYWKEICYFRLRLRLRKFVPKIWINNITALVQIMACRLVGAKPLSEPMVISLLKHIYMTRPQWVKGALHRVCLMMTK